MPASLEGALVTNDFPLFNLNPERLEPEFLGWLCRTSKFVELCQRASEGTTNRVRLQEDRFLELTIPLPPLPEQRRVVARIEELAAQINNALAVRRQADLEAEALPGALANRLFSEPVSRAAIEAVAEVRGGIQKGPHRAPGANPVRYLTVAHVQRNHVSTDDPRFFEVTRAELERWRLNSGDVLIIEGNGSAQQIESAITNCLTISENPIRLNPI